MELKQEISGATKENKKLEETEHRRAFSSNLLLFSIKILLAYSHSAL
jgi:hypothetical protein